MSRSFIEQSKINWIPGGDGNANHEQIQIGCLQRIATATELIAINHTSLINDRDRYKRWYEQEREEKRKLKLKHAAMKGVVTKLQKKLNS